jgi:hypothetical protein
MYTNRKLNNDRIIFIIKKKGFVMEVDNRPAYLPIWYACHCMYVNIKWYDSNKDY